jgi:hypothetical protein
LQEFNFKVIYKPRKVHFVPNQLLHVFNRKPTVVVEDQLLDVVIFLLTYDWYTPIKEYVTQGIF